LLWECFLAVLLVLGDGFFQSFLGTLVHDEIVPYEAMMGGPELEISQIVLMAGDRCQEGCDVI
jgi:hypothetical protein